jgi:hypothetical protein
MQPAPVVAPDSRLRSAPPLLSNGEREEGRVGVHGDQTLGSREPLITTAPGPGQPTATQGDDGRINGRSESEYREMEGRPSMPVSSTDSHRAHRLLLTTLLRTGQPTARHAQSHATTRNCTRPQSLCVNSVTTRGSDWEPRATEIAQLGALVASESDNTTKVSPANRWCTRSHQAPSNSTRMQVSRVNSDVGAEAPVPPVALGSTGPERFSRSEAHGWAASLVHRQRGLPV